MVQFEVEAGAWNVCYEDPANIWISQLCVGVVEKLLVHFGATLRVGFGLKARFRL